jgi:hypothetical protein
MSEFKVGDSVRLKDGLKVGIYYGGIEFLYSMIFKGNAKIIEVSLSGNFTTDQRIFRYSPQMLEMAEQINAPLSLSEIIERNYNATVSRGLIDNETSVSDFMDKLWEELKELESSRFGKNGNSFDPKELSDIALVCFAMAKHFNIDLLKVMEEKTIFNETRED